MDQILHGFWVGPTDDAKVYGLPQELETAREAGYFSSQINLFDIFKPLYTMYICQNVVWCDCIINILHMKYENKA